MQQSNFGNYFFFFSCMLFLTALSSKASALSSYNNGAIYAYGAGAVESLTSINASIADASLLQNLGNKEWLLKVPLIVNDSQATLKITGDDVSWLKMQSNNDTNIAYLKIQGKGVINNTKITSWNTTNGVVAPNNDTDRSYILITGINACANITNSTISNLGSTGFLKYGITYDSRGESDIQSSTIANSTYGIFSYHSRALTITDNNITGTDIEGILLSYGYGSDTVLRNNIYNNTGHGLSIQNSTLVANNSIYYNGKSGIWSGWNGANNSIIDGNTIYSNDLSEWFGGGIYLDLSYNNIVQNNLVYGNDMGIHLEIKASNNTIRNNTVYNNTYYYGINLEQVNGNYVIDNTLYRNTYSLGLCNAKNNLIENNTIFNASQTGLYLECGGNENNTFKNNTIYGNVQRDIYIYDNLWNGTINNRFIENRILDSKIGSAYENIIRYTSINFSKYDMEQYLSSSLTNTFEKETATKYQSSVNSSMQITDPMPPFGWFTLQNRGDFNSRSLINFTSNRLASFNIPGASYIMAYPAYSARFFNDSLNRIINVTLYSGSITPFSDYINITVINWSASPLDNYYKKWNESAPSQSVSAIHTIGDFPANSSITIRINGSYLSRHISNTSGFINFTNGGKYPVLLEAFLGNSMVYYVAKDGSDSNAGTVSSPWKTIQKAANESFAGDIVYVKEGIYNEQIIITNSGSSGKYITFAPFPGDTVTINGSGVLVSSWGGLFQVVNKNYINISGFRVINAPQAGVHIDGSNYTIIENNYFISAKRSPIKVGWGYSGNIILNNNVIDRQDTESHEEAISVSNAHTIDVTNNHIVENARGEGIDLKDGTSDGKVNNNLVENTSAVGIYIDAYQDHTYNIKVSNNIVHNSETDGFSAASERGGLLENITFYNNIAYNNSQNGFSLSGYTESGYSPNFKDISFLNNIAYKNGISGWGGGILLYTQRQDMYANNILLRNNIFSDNILWQISDNTNSNNANIVLTIDHNLINGFRGYSNETKGTNPIEADPKFVNPSLGDFHLQSNSAAIDSGSSDGAPALDFDGNSRPKGAGIDIGAFEYLYVVSTADGLNMVFNTNATISSIRLNSAELISTSASGIQSGFYIKDYAAGTPLAQLNATIAEYGANSIKTSGNYSNISFNATYTEYPRYIKIDGELKDESDTDRAIQIAFILPINATGWNWWDYVRQSRLINSSTTYKNTYTIGTTRQQSVYPFSEIGNSSLGLSIAVPMDVPRIYRITYNTTAGYRIEYDFGLSNLTEKIGKSRANFTFIIYKADEPEWAFRSATKKYYGIYPQFFEKRNLQEGLLVYYLRNFTITNISDFGIVYSNIYATTTEDVITNNKLNRISSLAYTEPWGWWKTFGPNAIEPNYTEKVAALLNDSVNGTGIWSNAQVKDVAQAVINSSLWNQANNYTITSNDEASGFWHSEWGQNYPTNPNPNLPLPSRYDISYRYELKKASGIINWTSGDNWSLSNTTFNSGKYSMQVMMNYNGITNNSGALFFIGTSPLSSAYPYTLRAIPNTNYTLSAWIKTENASGNKIAVRVAERNNTGFMVKQDVIQGTDSNSGWVLKNKTFTSDSNALYFEIYANIWQGNGTGWIDDITLTMQGSDNNLVNNNGFEIVTDETTLYHDGVLLDSLGAGSKDNLWRAYKWAQLENYRTEHWKYTTLPLVFSYESKVPTILQLFSNYEYILNISNVVHSQNKVVAANIFGGHDKYAHMLDITGSELFWGFSPDWQSSYKRTLSNHKLISDSMSLPNTIDSFDEMKQYVDAELFYAIYPSVFYLDSINSSIAYFWSNATQYNSYRPLFKKYIPIIRNISAAGWEPIPYATFDNSNIWIERYGNITNNSLHFTVRTEATTNQTGAFTVELTKLGTNKTELYMLSSTELVSQNTTTPTITIRAENTTVKIPLSIASNDTLVYKLDIQPINAFVTPSSDYLNITIANWTTDYKSWTESSLNASVTSQHTIGSFSPNTQIMVKKNANYLATYASNSSGYINFTYSGGYSDIQFEALPTTCSDGIKNQDEIGIDCGGSCSACGGSSTSSSSSSSSSGSGSSRSTPYSGNITPPKKECTANENCSLDKYCSDSKCAPVICECGIIEKHACKKYECCKDTGCAQSEICQDNRCEKIKEQMQNNTTNTLKDAAEKAIADTKIMIISKKQTRDTKQAESLLSQAETYYAKEQYRQAKELSDQARILAENAPHMPENEKEPKQDTNWLVIVASIAILLIIIIIAILKRNYNRKPAANKTAEDASKLELIENYLNSIRPIIAVYKAESRLDKEQEERLLEIESEKDKAKQMLKDKDPTAKEQIEKISKMLVQLKKDIEDSAKKD